MRSQGGLKQTAGVFFEDLRMSILKQLPVAQPLGIEDNFDRLGVAAMVAVSRIRNVTAAVAHSGRDYAPCDVARNPAYPRNVRPAKDRTSRVDISLLLFPTLVLKQPAILAVAFAFKLVDRNKPQRG
jgi:hypothetical protein